MMHLEGQLLQGRYLIDSMIGQGGMSYVYRAADQRMNRQVAIKVLKEEYCEDEEFIRKFKNEAQAAAQLNHPNIVAAYDVVDEDKLHFIVMELVEGITLKNYIQRKGRLENKEAVGIALQVIDGIAQAHRMGIVHRDVKPQNMIVGEDGIVKMADFGIARAATQQTVNATVMGSVHYISPEQARSGISDERSDIYSFGVTLFEMLTGKVPFDGENSVAVVLAHIENTMPHVRELVPEVYPAIDAAVWKCTQKKPDRRYQHIDELAEDLRRALLEPDGDFVDVDATEEDELGETRILSAFEVEQIKNQTRNKADRLIEGLVRDADELDGDEISEKLNHIYRLIALGCIAIIVVLAVMIGGNLLGYMGFGSSTVTELSNTLGKTETASTAAGPINITISAIENRIESIIGMQTSEAEAFLAEYDLGMKVVGAAFSDNYETGMVISYPSEKYEAGDTVEVTISKGAETLDLSDAETLHKTSFEALKRQLDERSIAVETEEVYSDTVPAGNIVASNKEDTSGSDMLKLTVSKGAQPKYANMPDLFNRTEQEARSLLEQAGLVVGGISHAVSDAVAAGHVSAQQTAAGTLLTRGAAVHFTISTGPAQSQTQSPAEQPGAAQSDAAAQPQVAPARTDTSEKWYSNINESCVVGEGGPGVEGTILVTIRLRQWVDDEYRYTVLQKPRSYELGTEVQVVFGNIEGVAGVETGTVEVVDASTDTVIQSYGCSFGP